MSIQLVVARYTDNLQWITEPPFSSHPYIVYNKGPNESFIKTSMLQKIVSLPNVGRDMHTFLYHIINNYDTLADNTVFLLDTLFRADRLVRAKAMVQAVEQTHSSVFGYRGGNFNMNQLDWIYNFKIGDDDPNFKLAEVRPFGKWFEHMFTNGEQNMCISWNCLISITREDIIKKPKSYYERLIKEVDDHDTPEAVHYLERALYAVFFPYTKVYCLG